MTEQTSPLHSEIKRLIQSSGPMPVWRYMELCLTHPEHGYYVSRDPLGREGDFTTAPEVSQMFGELLGLVGRLGVEGDRVATGAAADRTRTRPRHHDGGCAARAAGVAAALSGAQRPSRRNQSGVARKAEDDAARASATLPGTTISTTCRTAPPSFSPTNISTCFRSTRWSARRPAGTSGRSISTATATSSSAPPPSRCRASRCCCRRWCAPPRSARCSNGGPIPRS